MTARLLWLPPVAVFLGLAAWALADILRVPDPRTAAGLGVLLFAAGMALVVGLGLRSAPLRRLGTALLLAAYLGSRVAFHGVEVLTALTFLVLLILGVELRILAERFAPILARPLDAEMRRRIEGALARSILRLSFASALALLLSVLTADLALAGTIPVTTIPTAVVLAAALVGLVLLLALWPTSRRRAA